MGIEWLLIDDFEHIVLDKYKIMLAPHYIPIRLWKRGNTPIGLFKKVGKVNIPKFE